MGCCGCRRDFLRDDTGLKMRRYSAGLQLPGPKDRGGSFSTRTIIKRNPASLQPRLQHPPFASTTTTMPRAPKKKANIPEPNPSNNPTIKCDLERCAAEFGGKNPQFSYRKHLKHHAQDTPPGKSIDKETSEYKRVHREAYEEYLKQQGRGFPI